MSRTAAFGGKQNKFYELSDGSLGYALANLHYAAAKELGFGLTYIPKKAAIGGLEPLYKDLCSGAAGFAVASPFKTEILMLLDSVDDDARTIGACNLVVCDEGGFKGVNTDWASIHGLLKTRGFRPKNNDALVIGTGATARASLYALWRLGFTRMRLAGRSAPRAQSISNGLGFVMGADVIPVEYPGAISSLEMDRFDVVVNATPLGRNGEDPLLGRPLGPGLSIIDLVLTSTETPLVGRSAEVGRLVLRGVDVAKAEARLDVRAWTNLATSGNPLGVEERATKTG